MNSEPLCPDLGCVGLESLEYRAVMTRRGFVGILAVVQEDPCPVFISDAHMYVGRFELSRADDELALAYRRHRRHIRLQGNRTSSLRRNDCITM